MSYACRKATPLLRKTQLVWSTYLLFWSELYHHDQTIDCA